MLQRGLILLGALALTATCAEAEDGSGCAKFKWSVAREQTAFATPSLPEIGSGQTLPGVMDAVTLKLQTQGGVTFAHPPGKPPRVDPAYAGIFTLTPIAVAGTYQITLSDEAWIDVIQEGKDVRSSGFSGQTACPGIRKSVRFALQGGPTTVQISGAAVDKIKLDILPVE